MVIIVICPGNISNKSSAIGTKEVFLKGNMYHFSVDYNSIDNSNILNIRKLLMVKSST